MPNWCWSQVHISTDEEKLNKLFGEMSIALSSNPLGADFGNEWLGNLLVYTGMDKDEVISGHIGCRGSITDFGIDDNGELMMNLETAWNPQFGAIKKFIEFVLGKDAEYGFRYTAEESGCGLYCSNDDEVIDTYHIDAWDCDDALDHLIAFYSYTTEDDLKCGLEEYLGHDGEFDDLMEEATAKAEEDGRGLYFNKYDYIDWHDFT